MNNSYKKKLIEVALPLPEINDASAYDKMPGIGPHPKGIHHWWARLPLPTARAVLFASVVDDPESHPEKWPSEELQNAERERLFQIIRGLMAKKLHQAPALYSAAHDEMLRHSDGNLPSVFDPFAGGGSIPLEANRLGFDTYAADLNPVAVLLNRCNLELAPRWTGSPPINVEDRGRIGGSGKWAGTTGLAADVRYYARIIGQKAREQLGKLYPKATLPHAMGNTEVSAIAWIWARTVASPDPAAKGKHVPLISSYWLSNNKNNPVWLKPIVDKSKNEYRFDVVNGPVHNLPEVSAGTRWQKGFRCILTSDPITFDYVRAEGQHGRLGKMLLVVVAEGKRGRIYVNADHEHIASADVALPPDYPDTDLPEEALGFRVQNYGIRKHWQMFTSRQLAAMVTFSDLIKNIKQEIEKDALDAGKPPEDADQYAVAVITFLALALDRCSDFNNAFCGWSATNQKVMHLFGRAIIPMIWDFAEANILAGSVGGWSTCSEYVADCVEVITAGSPRLGHAYQCDASEPQNGITNVLVSTDPPYYDNMGYAALSDFFYVWLRRTVGCYPKDLFNTVLTPNTNELTAAPERFGGDEHEAKEHFETGFRRAFAALRERMDPRFPLTVYYAFKQDDEEKSDDPNSSSVDLTTGWETLLEALISSKFQITATWPVRASQKWRMRAMGANALASYIVLACRPRPDDAPRISSLQFRQELKSNLPSALRHLQQGNVAPVDFAQAAIGPGMAIYSRYGSILESSGSRLSVRAALGLINQVLNEVLNEQEDEFDGETRWAIAWFEQNGFTAGLFGDAELLSKAKVTSNSALQESGLVVSGAGEVRLKRPEELPEEWTADDSKRTVWGMTHHLIRIYYHDKAGDEAAATLLRQFSSKADLARDLALRLFRISEKKGLLTEAQGYNALGLGWSEIAKLAQKTEPPAAEQARLI